MDTKSGMGMVGQTTSQGSFQISNERYAHDAVGLAGRNIATPEPDHRIIPVEMSLIDVADFFTYCDLTYGAGIRPDLLVVVEMSDAEATNFSEYQRGIPVSERVPPNATKRTLSLKPLAYLLLVTVVMIAIFVNWGLNNGAF